MGRRSIAMVPVLLAALLLMPAGQAGAGGGGGCREPAAVGEGVTVDMRRSCFLPTVLYAPAGESVTFVNRDDYPHTVTGVGPWGTGFEEMDGGEAIGVTFERDGVYVYTCILHPGMSGAVVVGDATGPGAAKDPERIVMEPIALASEVAEEPAATVGPFEPVEPDESEEAAALASTAAAGDDSPPWPGIAVVIGVAAAGLGFGLGRSRRRA